MRTHIFVRLAASLAAGIAACAALSLRSQPGSSAGAALARPSLSVLSRVVDRARLFSTRLDPRYSDLRFIADENMENDRGRLWTVDGLSAQGVGVVHLVWQATTGQLIVFGRLGMQPAPGQRRITAKSATAITRDWLGVLYPEWNPLTWKLADKPVSPPNGRWTVRWVRGGAKSYVTLDPAGRVVLALLRAS